MTKTYGFALQPVEVYSDTAVITTYVNNPTRTRVNTVGCYVWDNYGNLIIRHTEFCNRPESRFKVWYDIRGEIGVKLRPGTTYRYCLFVLDGKEYRSSVRTFTTRY